MKNIVVTGSNGFIGQNLLTNLSKKNTVYAISRSNKKKNSKNLIYLSYKELSVFLKNDENKIDCFIHTAAISPSPKITAKNYISSNIILTKKLINLCLRYNVKNFIFLSSLSIYGEINSSFVDEKTQVINPNSYGLSKLICENLIKDNYNKINYSIIRLPGVIGKNSVRNWLTNLLNDIKKNKDVSIYNPKHKFNNLIHISDLSKFISSLVSLKYQKNDTICIATYEKINLLTLVKKLIKINNSSSKINIMKSKTKSFYIKNYKIKNKYNFQPMSTIRSLEIFSHENNR